MAGPNDFGPMAAPHLLRLGTLAKNWITGRDDDPSSMTEPEAADVRRRVRGRQDISLPMETPGHAADISLPMPTPSAPASEGSGEGQGLSDRVTLHAPREDYEADVPGFLARGSSPEIGQMADAMGVRADIDENMFSGRRPDLLAAEQGRLAVGGLRNARQREAQQLDPGFARENAALDDISEAQTFMNPSVMGQRQQQRSEGLAQARGMQDVEIGGKTDPRVMGLLFQQWLQQQQLAQINASGRNPFGSLLGGGAGGPQQQPGGGPQQAATGGPQRGEQRKLRSGETAEWDGTGWKILE